ncbi:hypothetical protein DOY81_007106 [Sarcophaga bullata]|nr:hypothetical protein DOY81_007106 [Sarcophaga bullata]
MVNSNKSKQTSKSQPNKFNRTGGVPHKKSAHGKATAFVKSSGKIEHGTKGSGGPYKKPAHGKAAFTKSKEAQKHERAKKFQERQALKAQKQKELEEERAKAKKEKEEKIRLYKKKRLEKTKALSKKTQRGQPLMKDRMQLLLKQIQEMKKNG